MCARKTTQELAALKKQREKEKEQERVKQIEQEISILESRIKWARLSSEVQGLYDELNKIYLKAPEEQISKLQVDNINIIIQDSKDIATDDPYIKRIAIFVPAGDNPEYRDAITVLKQIIQGLQRYKASYLHNYADCDLGALIKKRTELQEVI